MSRPDAGDGRIRIIFFPVYHPSRPTILLHDMFKKLNLIGNEDKREIAIIQISNRF